MLETIGEVMTRPGSLKNYIQTIIMSHTHTYTLNSELKALTGDKSDDLKSRRIAEVFFRGFMYKLNSKPENLCKQ